MSEASKNLKNAFKPGAKGRTGYLVAVVGFVVIAGIIVVMAGKSHAASDSSASVAPIPKMQSIPGASTSTEAYQQTVQQSNQAQEQKAAATGQSAIPTIDTRFQKVDDPNKPQPGQQPQMTPQQYVMPQQQTQQQQEVDSGASKQANILLALWAPPKTEIVDGTAKEAAQKAAGVQAVQAVKSTAPAASNAGNAAKVLIPAGKLLFATLDNSLNTDQPGPVVATVVEGPFKGAKLLGQMTVAKDAIGIMFNTMSFNDHTIAVKATGMDQQSTASALASNVDHHYFAKYGAIFMGALLGGYGDAASRGDQSITQSATGAVITQSPLSPSLRTMVALGKAGSAVGTAMGNVASQIQTTVKVPYGTAISVQFLADVTTK